MSTLMNSLKAARRYEATTITELALRTGSSRTTVSAYEHGQKSPTISTFERIASGLGYGASVFKRDDYDTFWIDPELRQRIEAMRGGPGSKILDVSRNIDSFVLADVMFERIKISANALKRRAEGGRLFDSPGIDDLDVARAGEIVDSAVCAIRDAGQGRAQLGPIVAKGWLIEPVSELDFVERCLNLYLRAVARGGDPIWVRHRINAVLLQEGYPWLGSIPIRWREMRLGISGLKNFWTYDNLLNEIVMGAEAFWGAKDSVGRQIKRALIAQEDAKCLQIDQTGKNFSQNSLPIKGTL